MPTTETTGRTGCRGAATCGGWPSGDRSESAMHEFAIYDTRTGAITGYFSASTNELLPKPLSDHEAFVELVEPAHRDALAKAREAQLVARGTVKDGVVAELRTEPRFTGRL